METGATARRFPKRPKRRPTRVAKVASDKPSRPPRSFYDEFKEFMGIIRDCPGDLAQNHKQHANGKKKWK